MSVWGPCSKLKRVSSDILLDPIFAPKVQHYKLQYYAKTTAKKLVNAVNVQITEYLAIQYSTN